MLSPFATNLLAIGVLVALALVALAVAAVQLRRSPLTMAQSVCCGLNYLLSRVLWRVEVRGRVSAACGHGAVIVCNHRGPVDPSFIQVLAGLRAVHWMVAKEYCRHPALAWFFRIAEAIPVSRGGIDTAATKLAIRYAEEGELVGLFPEGRINIGRDVLLPGRPGAALIALRARVPVIPCYVSGSPYTGTTLGPLVTPAKVRLVMGEPLDISAFYGREGEREVLEELTRQFLRAIARLAGHPDFHPSLAGRFYKDEPADAENGLGDQGERGR
jgi:1-acyl-sn-glycerol-3-phosphate acyltransferase